MNLTRRRLLQGFGALAAAVGLSPFTSGAQGRYLPAPGPSAPVPDAIPGRLTAPRAGRYVITYRGSVLNSEGIYHATIKKNGVPIASTICTGTDPSGGLVASVIAEMAEGDYVDISPGQTVMTNLDNGHTYVEYGRESMV